MGPGRIIAVPETAQALAGLPNVVTGRPGGRDHQVDSPGHSELRVIGSHRLNPTDSFAKDNDDVNAALDVGHTTTCASPAGARECTMRQPAGDVTLGRARTAVCTVWCEVGQW